MQDRPEAPELLDAVAAYLFAELRPLVPSGERFRLLVAANVCAVVAREIRAGGEPDRADSELFEALLEATDEPGRPGDGDEAEPRELAARLAAELRAGSFDDRLEEVFAALAAHVRRKLEIARPGYATGEDGGNAGSGSLG